MLFEFDNDSSVADGAVAMPIGGSADATFSSLAAAIGSAVPFTTVSLRAAFNALTIRDDSANSDGIYLSVERDQGGVFPHPDMLAGYFGVRDVANHFTYVEHESGEVELYDLAVDPAQLTNRAGDPTYAEAQARLAARLDELLQ